MLGFPLFPPSPLLYYQPGCDVRMLRHQRTAAEQRARTKEVKRPSGAVILNPLPTNFGTRSSTHVYLVTPSHSIDVSLQVTLALTSGSGNRGEANQNRQFGRARKPGLQCIEGGWSHLEAGGTLGVCVLGRCHCHMLPTPATPSRLSPETPRLSRSEVCTARKQRLHRLSGQSWGGMH
jgi:hypothetical protein